MSILSEWFHWGDNELIFCGMIIMLISALVPLGRRHMAIHAAVAGVCLLVYVVCEMFVANWVHNWIRAYVSLYVGGFAFSVAVGRIVRFVLFFWMGRREQRRSRRYRGSYPPRSRPGEPTGNNVVDIRDWRRKNG